MAIIALSEIIISGLYSVDILTDISGLSCVNEHLTFEYKGLITRETKCAIEKDSEPYSKVEITHNSNSIFVGYVTYCLINEIGIDSYSLYVKLISYSKKSDQIKKNRFFQDEDQSYSSVIKEAYRDSSDNASLIINSGEYKINRPILQYNETDWQLTRRLASQDNTLLVVNAQSSHLEVSIGIPKRPIVNIEEKDIIKETYSKLDFLHNKRKSSTECITLRSKKSYRLGDITNYKKDYMIYKICYTSKNGFMCEEYYLSELSLHNIDPYDNEEIIGLELYGTVIDTSGIVLKVKLDIDKSRNAETDFWYIHEPITNNGMYSMPIKNEKIALQWQSSTDKDVVSSYCYRLNSDSLPTHKDKYMQTEHKNLMSFLPDSVNFKTPTSGLTFNAEGILVDTKGIVSINAKQVLDTLSKQQTNMSSPEEIKIRNSKTNSCIVMQLGDIDIIANEKTKIITDLNGKEAPKIVREKFISTPIPTENAASIVSSIPSKCKL